MSNIRPIRPLTIQEMRAKAAAGKLTPQDIHACSWITRARKIKIPYTEAEQLSHDLMFYVRAWRQDRGMTIKELEQLAGLPAATLGQLENGFRKANLDVLLKLARAVGAELRVTFIRPKQLKRSA